VITVERVVRVTRKFRATLIMVGIEPRPTAAALDHGLAPCPEVDATMRSP
jgi:hypothetical protein